MILSREEIASKVQKGAEFLDEKRPNWRKEINWEILDMRSLSHCIVAQLFNNDYWLGAQELGYALGSDYGFDFQVGSGNWDNYVVLDELWREIGAE
jgi:hypothetical protein